MDKKKRRAPIACLYAAPGFFPRDKEKKGGDEADIKEVYAAPEFFENGGEGEEPEVSEDARANEEYPANYEEAPETPFVPDPAVMMCVYAGPDYFAGKTDIHGNPLPGKDGEEERPLGAAAPDLPEEGGELMLQGEPPIPDENPFSNMPLMGLVRYDPDKEGVIGDPGMMSMNAMKEKKPFVERENGKQPNFCRECGGKLGPDMKFCPNCGAKVVKC